MRRWFGNKGILGRSTLCEPRQRLGVVPLVRLATNMVQLLDRLVMRVAFYKGIRQRRLNIAAERSFDEGLLGSNTLVYCVTLMPTYSSPFSAHPSSLAAVQQDGV